MRCAFNVAYNRIMLTIANKLPTKPPIKSPNKPNSSGLRTLEPSLNGEQHMKYMMVNTPITIIIQAIFSHIELICLFRGMVNINFHKGMKCFVLTTISVSSSVAVGEDRHASGPRGGPRRCRTEKSSSASGPAVFFRRSAAVAHLVYLPEATDPFGNKSS